MASHRGSPESPDAQSMLEIAASSPSLWGEDEAASSFSFRIGMENVHLSYLFGVVSIVGVVIGAALLLVLQTAITHIDWIPDTIQFAVIGGVIIAGAMADEIFRRAVSRRRIARGNQQAGRPS